MNNYYPFGMQQPTRNFNSPNYRYGFQGQEKDSELKGEGNSINYKYRMHDPRIGRFFAVDPLTKKYPHYSPYSFSGNKVIHAVELEGLEEKRIVIFKSEQEAKAVISAWNEKDGKEALNQAINAVNNNVASQIIVDSFNDMDIVSVVYLREGNIAKQIFNAESKHYNGFEKALNWLNNRATGGIYFSDGGFLRSGIAGKPRKGSDGIWIDFDGGLTAIIAALSVGKKGSPGAGKTPKGKGTNGGNPTQNDKVTDAVNAVRKTGDAAKQNIKNTQEFYKDTTLTLPTYENVEILNHREGNGTIRLTPGNVDYTTTTNKVDSLKSAISKKNKKTEAKGQKVLDSLTKNPPKNK